MLHLLDFTLPFVLNISMMASTQREGNFAFSDHVQWLQYLRDHGYVVVKGTVSHDEVTTAKNLMWDWLENLGSGIRRDDIRTWRNENWPGCTFLGFLSTFGGGQTEASWYLRGLPSVRNVFERIWDTEELITSMDTFIVWRPWWLSPDDEEWVPNVERLHCDQNPFWKPGFHCVQGMIPLLPVNQISGGLQVVPDTHTDEVQEYLKTNYPHTKSGSDWCQLHHTDKYIGTGVLLEADPGDMILWDSRLIHGGKVGDGYKRELAPSIPDLARLSLTVCMTPKAKAQETVLEQRREAVKKGWTLTHWPHEFNRNSMGNTDAQNVKYKYKPPVLTPEQQKLVG